MAQPGISAKIEELQFRIKTDPRSRLFFPLAEELRRNGRLPEAEQVLRTGLGVHATYLSAWVSLGRVLREQQKNAEAVDALNTALQVDPGNVVAARLLADAYFDLGEKVEAIKKYKLVHALMPSDEELKAKIEQIELDLRAAAPAPFAPVEDVQESPFAGPELAVPAPAPTFAARAEMPFATSETPFDETMPITRTVESPFSTGDEVPMLSQHAESPFEEPSGYTAAALEVEQPAGMHIEEAPLIAADVPLPSQHAESPFGEPSGYTAALEVEQRAGMHIEEAPLITAEAPSVWLEEPETDELASEPAADVFAPAEPETAPQDDDVTATTTMADLYVRQGLIDEARKIYEHLLQRDPYDEDVRTKLDALDRKGAELPSDEVAEAIQQPGNQATESEEAAWQLGSPVNESELPPQPGDPATLHRHAQVVVLRQWLARVSRRETTGA